MLRVDAATGLVAGARYVPSPNRDERPAGQPPELVVVHGISLPPGEFGGPWIERLFTNTLPPDEHPYFATIAGQRVSAHVLIRRDGSLVQFVPLHLRAWHAGASSWRGRERCNDFSIGIELEGADTTPTRTRSTVRSRRWSRRCCAPTRRSPPIRLQVTRTSRRGARPTRARPSNGRGFGLCCGWRSSCRRARPRDAARAAARPRRRARRDAPPAPARGALARRLCGLGSRPPGRPQRPRGQRTVRCLGAGSRAAGRARRRLARAGRADHRLARLRFAGAGVFAGATRPRRRGGRVRGPGTRR
jgi:hypothetical protein